MAKLKVTRAEQLCAEKQALKLLQSPRFFRKFLRAVERAGLIGEKRNALVLLIVVVSRLLRRPLNIFVKGNSSSGKNWLVTRILGLIPKTAVAEITSASEQAWSYSGGAFRHRVVYVQEQNEAAGTIDPIRLLISEGKLVRIIAGFENGIRIAKRQVARGPVAAISTTTRNRLQIDDETRHISIWVDESADQTRRIVKSYTQRGKLLRRDERMIWHAVHRLLETRIGITIGFPKWFEKVEDRLFVNDLRVRRYYPAFVEACRTVCLIRSFLPERRSSEDDQLRVDFADFAITAMIFDEVFVESLHLGKGTAEATRRAVEEIAARKGRAVGAKDIASKLCISMDQAYSRLRYAERVGAIRRANKPERGNPKRFTAGPSPRFVPDPENLFRKISRLGETVRFSHPLTGERVTYKRER